ncbi:MAG: hypothetical protein JO127_15050 [Caulobacteraceae bacterium]|nr:hypothetical protein [Caulobacteraceae bacterium]
MRSARRGVTRPWRKLGRVLEASGEPLSRTHVMLPTPHVTGDRVRVFYASCDADLRGRIFFADFEPAPPFRLMGRSPSPVLDVGPAGAFDCDGVNPSQALDADGRLALLYIGWRRGPPESPYTLFGAVAFSDDGGASFARASAPLLAPRPGERLFRTAPFVERGGEGWRLLYIGGDAFEEAGDGRRLPSYSLMTLESGRLWDWQGAGKVLMAPDAAAGEIGFGRPVSYATGRARRLMLSVRTREGYRLMETARDFQGRPLLTPVIPAPFEAWESQMTCFGAPCVVEGRELLFYNGDGYGRTGLGLAWRPAGQLGLPPRALPRAGRISEPGQSATR